LVVVDQSQASLRPCQYPRVSPSMTLCAPSAATCFPFQADTLRALWKSAVDRSGKQGEADGAQQPCDGLTCFW
jgi:hypothetical protein